MFSTSIGKYSNKAKKDKVTKNQLKKTEHYSGVLGTFDYDPSLWEIVKIEPTDKSWKSYDIEILKQFTEYLRYKGPIFNGEIIGNIPDADIVALIGNILDNALEAVDKIDNEREKRIELHFWLKNTCRIILCKNTIVESVLVNNSQLITTKKGVGHGYGNRIIQSISQKYGGFVEYSEHKGMFYVQVILP